MNFTVGTKARVIKPGPGEDRFFGEVEVVRVLKTCVVTSDGRRWRMNGIEQGAQPERGVGLAFATRIVARGSK